ncbi:MAG: hypothetical protein ACT4RN_10320 [Pseudonocardia sp.]
MWDDLPVVPDTWRAADHGSDDWLAIAGDLCLCGVALRRGFPELSWVEILHPAYREAPDGSRVAVPWSAISAAAPGEPVGGGQFDSVVGLPVHEFENGIDDPTGSWTHPPEQGTLPADLASVIHDLLAGHTSASGAYIGAWSGWAVMAPYRGTDVPVVTAFGRDHLFFRSPVSALADSIDAVDHQSANLWFPDDRRWLLVTDIDHWSTFIGGPLELASDMRAAGLEFRT